MSSFKEISGLFAFRLIVPTDERPKRDIILGFNPRPAVQLQMSVQTTVNHSMSTDFFYHFPSSPPCSNWHLRGGGVAPLLQQEQNWGAVANCEVLLLSRTSGRHHQSCPIVRRWYVPVTQYFIGSVHLFFFFFFADTPSHRFWGRLAEVSDKCQYIQYQVYYWRNMLKEYNFLSVTAQRNEPTHIPFFQYVLDIVLFL